MKMTFICPSCGASASMDAAHAGKQVRCKQCQYRFTLPSSDEPDDTGYTLQEPLDKVAPNLDTSVPEGPVFVPSRGDEPPAGDVRRTKKRKATRVLRPQSQGRASGFPWPRRLAQGGALFVVILAIVALSVPNGVIIAALALLALGSVMILVSYAAGAYGAFSEDFLYGFLYVVIPFYAAYYIVSRWDDLWIWVACSTTGAVLILFGTAALRWAGINV